MILALDFFLDALAIELFQQYCEEELIQDHLADYVQGVKEE